MMKKHLSYLCFAALLAGCISRPRQENMVEDDSPYSVSLEKAIDNMAPVGLSQIGGSITYIPLETSRTSLVGEIRKAIVKDSLIFIKTIPYSLMAFDRSGRFVRNYGNVGRGPGEYLDLLDFAVSPDQSKVYILDRGSICITYDVDGTFLNRVKMRMGTLIIPYNDSLFVLGVPQSRLWPGMIGEDTDISVLFSDLEGRVIKTYDYHHPFEGNISPPDPSLYASENGLRFFEPVADTLYTITSDSLTPYAVFTAGKHSIPLDFYSTVLDYTEFRTTGGANYRAFVANYTDKIALRSILEDRERIYIRAIRYPDGELCAFFDKRTGETKVANESGFTNDLDGGLPFFPKYVYNDEVLVDYVDAYVLKEHVASLGPTEMTRLYGDNYTRLAALAESLEEDSNPVMIMVSK
jgi:hypothetical protein